MQHKMYKYGLQAQLRAKPGKGRELANILCEASLLVTAQPECNLYLVGVDLIDDCLIRITEVWTSSDAHKASLNTPEVKALIGRAMPLLAEMPTGQGGFDLVSDLED